MSRQCEQFIKRLRGRIVKALDETAEVGKTSLIEKLSENQAFRSGGEYFNASAPGEYPSEFESWFTVNMEHAVSEDNLEAGWFLTHPHGDFVLRLLEQKRGRKGAAASFEEDKELLKSVFFDAVCR